MPGNPLFLMPGKCCGCEAVIPCVPCNIPKADLTVSWTGIGIVASGSAVAHYDGSAASKTGCITLTASGTPFALEGIFAVVCSSGHLVAGFLFTAGCGGPDAPGCLTGDDPPFAMTLADYTCSPFHLHLTLTELGCDYLGAIISDLYFDE